MRYALAVGGNRCSLQNPGNGAASNNIIILYTYLRCDRVCRVMLLQSGDVAAVVPVFPGSTYPTPVRLVCSKSGAQGDDHQKG